MAGTFLYDPNSSYGYKPLPGPWQNANSYLDTYPGNLDAEQNPDAYFTGQLASQGLGGLDQKGLLARNLWGKTVDDYGAARLKNNELTFRQFLDPIDFNDVINKMTPQQRGENPSNVVPYDTRWLQR